MHANMPFRLVNIGATFQRDMDIHFVGAKEKFVVIYLDDTTSFSMFDEEHLKYLQQTFEKCRRYDLSLNPKKSHFVLKEGKLLGHILSREGLRLILNR